MKIAWTAFVLSLVGAVMLLGAHVANAQTQGAKCASIDKVVKMLRENHDEIPLTRMTDSKGVPMQLWGNLETGTWTLFYLKGDEQGTYACYLDEGGNLKIGG